MSLSNAPNTLKAATLIYVSGFVFAVIGTLLLAFPHALENYFAHETIRLLAGVLIFLGISDFLIARFLFDKVKTK